MKSKFNYFFILNNKRKINYENYKFFYDLNIKKLA